jgi:hypothetical protein
MTQGRTLEGWKPAAATYRSGGEGRAGEGRGGDVVVGVGAGEGAWAQPGGAARRQEEAEERGGVWLGEDWRRRQARGLLMAAQGGVAPPPPPGTHPACRWGCPSRWCRGRPAPGYGCRRSPRSPAHRPAGGKRVRGRGTGVWWADRVGGARHAARVRGLFRSNAGAAGGRRRRPATQPPRHPATSRPATQPPRRPPTCGQWYTMDPMWPRSSLEKNIPRGRRHRVW